jgi:hypothetical protein
MPTAEDALGVPEGGAEFVDSGLHERYLVARYGERWKGTLSANTSSQTTRFRGCTRRALAAAAAVTAALAIASPAYAGYWQYGPAWLGRGHDDSNCIWYRGQAACSGWNYWFQGYYSRQQSCCNYKYLHGFENNSTIRGLWIYDYVAYEEIYPSTVGMGGYLKTHLTWWSGNAVSVLAWANT